MQTCVQPLGWKDPWDKEWLTTAVFLPGEFHGVQRVGYDWANNTFTFKGSCNLNLILFIILFIVTRTERNMMVYRVLILKYFLMCKYFTRLNLIEEFSADFIPYDPCLS